MDMTIILVVYDCQFYRLNHLLLITKISVEYNSSCKQSKIKMLKKGVPFYNKMDFCFIFVTFCTVTHTLLFVFVTILHSITPLFLHQLLWKMLQEPTNQKRKKIFPSLYQWNDEKLSTSHMFVFGSLYGNYSISG